MNSGSSAKRKKGGPTGMCGGRLGARFVRRFEQHAEQAHPLGDVPGGERDLPTRREHACHLGGSALRPPEMEDEEVADHRVEGAVGEWEALGARLHELEPRMEPAGERDHLPRDVDADRRRAACGGGRGRVAGTGREIEHAGLRPDLGRVEQRLDHPLGEQPEEAVVAPCPLVPAGRLEGVEGFGVDGLRVHSAFDAGPKAGRPHRANRLIFRTRRRIWGDTRTRHGAPEPGRARRRVAASRSGAGRGRRGPRLHGVDRGRSRNRQDATRLRVGGARPGGWCDGPERALHRPRRQRPALSPARRGAAAAAEVTGSRQRRRLAA